jgi:HEPN domain-containing protein
VGSPIQPPGKARCFTRGPEEVKRQWVAAWLASAVNDLTTGEAALGASMSSYETASFHVQQAAEKSLKALLILVTLQDRPGLETAGG